MKSVIGILMLSLLGVGAVAFVMSLAIHLMVGIWWLAVGIALSVAGYIVVAFYLIFTGSRLKFFL